MCFPIKFDGSAPLSHISVCFAAHQTAQYSPSIVGSRLYDAKSFQMTVVVSWRYNNRTEVTPNNWLYWLQRPVTFVFPPVHFMVLFFVLFFWCVFVFFSWRMNLWFIGLHLSSRSFAMVSEPGCDTIKMEGRKKKEEDGGGVTAQCIPQHLSPLQPWLLTVSINIMQMSVLPCSAL